MKLAVTFQGVVSSDFIASFAKLWKKEEATTLKSQLNSIFNSLHGNPSNAMDPE
jgi:hypothetical protein